MNPNPSLQEYFQTMIKGETDTKVQPQKTDPMMLSGPQGQTALNTTKRNCNCKQSKCIKLYCECFNSNVFCDAGCNCVDCLNNDTNQQYREKAIKYTLNRNPNAFQPKIANTPTNDNKSLDIPINFIKHSKGCACKKSGCMKKYCECYQAKIACSEICKCSDCHNKVGMSGQFYKSSPTRDDEMPNKNSFLYKLLLAQDEGHLFNILNEKIVWNNNDNPSFALNKKQINLSLLDIEEACNKFYNIINQTEENFQKNTTEYPDFLTNKKKTEGSQIQSAAKSLSDSQINVDNEKIIKASENVDKNNNFNNNTDKNEEKSNIDNELLCEDEKLENIEEKEEKVEKMEIEEPSGQNERSEENPKGEQTNIQNERNRGSEKKQKKFSFSEIKKRLILKEFINILKNID